MIAVFPGQGAQTPGFLSPWLDDDEARARLEEFSAWSEVDLIHAGTVADADEIRDTRVAQPLIVAASLLSWEMFAAQGAISGTAGHSVGEFPALVAAGVLSAEDAMRLVGIRGRAMADAAAAADTGMSAVLGGDPEIVVSHLAALGLDAANHNGAGQIVAAGPRDALVRLSENAPAGTRVIPLSVAGAFHTQVMSPAVAVLRSAVASVTPSEPSRTLWSNRDGAEVSSGALALDLVVEQVASPVRWDACQASFAQAGVTGIVEFAPGGTLVGLAKRSLRGVPTAAIKTPDDLAAASDLVTGVSA